MQQRRNNVAFFFRSQTKCYILVHLDSEEIKRQNEKGFGKQLVIPCIVEFAYRGVLSQSHIAQLSRIYVPRYVRRRAIRHRAAREQFHGALYLTGGKTPGSCILRNRREICRKLENITPDIASAVLSVPRCSHFSSSRAPPDFGPRTTTRRESNCLPRDDSKCTRIDLLSAIISHANYLSSLFDFQQLSVSGEIWIKFLLIFYMKRHLLEILVFK